MGLAVLGMVLFGINLDSGLAQQTSPQGKTQEAVELPVDISIDVITRNENIPHSTEFTIDIMNSQSENEIHLILPGPGPRAPLEPPVTITKPDAPPVEAPPVEAPPVIETPPPADLPPVEAPPADAPPVAPIPPVESPPVDAPPANPVQTPQHR